MPNPDTDAREIALRLNTVAVHLNRRLRRFDDAIGLPPAQASALALLSAAGPHVISDLARYEKVSAPTMTRIVAALEDRGLVQRTREIDDQRKVTVAASREGRSLIKAALLTRTAQLAAAIDRLDAQDRRSLAAALPALASLAEVPEL